jgi:glycosyltransferase involved in cell wall biosynthesis
MELIRPPLVSIIVNCHNGEKFLNECLSSIQNQKYVNYEVIIWDNHSYDSTAVIAKSFQYSDNRFKYYFGNEFIELGKARNLALQECKGEFIAFLDSDDIWDSNFLKLQIKALSGNEDRFFGYGLATEFSGTLPQVNFAHISDSIKVNESIFHKLLAGNFIYFSSLVISRSGIDFVKEFNDNYIQAEDYDFILRLSLRFQGIQTGQIFYRLHENNFSKLQKFENFTENLEILSSHLRFRNAKLNFSKTTARFFLYSIQNQKILFFYRFIKNYNFWIYYLLMGLAYGYFKKVTTITGTILSLIKLKYENPKDKHVAKKHNEPNRKAD